MDEQSEAQRVYFLGLAADLVAAYVSNNNVPVLMLPKVIAIVYAALSGLGNAAPAEPDTPEKPTLDQIKKSITPDALISFLDGKPYKSIKRHLTKQGLTFDEYRVRYDLPKNYPSSSPNYSAKRSELARSFGLGERHRKAPSKATAAPKTASEAPKTRGRPRKTAEAPDAAPEAGGQKKVSESA